ncbi:MAG: hypothetical protein CM15mV47_820 [uncultured marine virus]|nr:MAG: hypothetical protein CM15mV47_820 [uncultured marine virus]
MARIATEDAGFIPEASRVPEAALLNNKAFYLDKETDHEGYGHRLHYEL